MSSRSSRRSSVISRGKKRAAAVLVAAAVATSGLSACTINGNGGDGEAQAAKGADKKKNTPPSFSLPDGATDVKPTADVTVKAGTDKLSQVTMTNEDGKEIKGELAPDGSSWKLGEVLGYGRKYTMKATTTNGDSSTSSFTTLSPQVQNNVAVTPAPDSTVGVGQSINFVFNEAPKNRKAVQDAIKITTSNNTVGAFYWISPNEVRWRPKDFWQPGTKVNVAANIYGTDMGDGVYGGDSQNMNFIIGDDVRAEVNDNTKTMTVFKNGQLLRTIPVSLGEDVPGKATPWGVYVVGERDPKILMDSTTFGLPYSQGGYSTMVDWATQLSYNGIYVHSAPWSIAQQGVSNTSHGCVNVSPEAARWFQETVKRGDVVTIENTSGGQLPGTDGLGQWNIPWETWSAGNANG